MTITTTATATATATERFEHLHPTDERLTPVLEDLVRDYHARYGDIEGHDARAEVYDGTAELFLSEQRGAFVALLDGDSVIATGGIRRFDDTTAEFKKVWAHSERRGQGLAKRMLQQLEDVARDLGYEKVYLYTGPRQPEADRLYQRAGYTPHFDSEAFTLHPYVKALVPDADASVVPGLVESNPGEFEGVVKHG